MPDAHARISKEIQFDSGHRVPKHSGKCRNPHGHRYRVVVSCEGTIIDDHTRSDDGMLVDFGGLKTIMMEYIHDVLDHKFIVWEDDNIMVAAITALVGASPDLNDDSAILFPYIPTAENIARWSWEQLERQIKVRFGDHLKLHKVTVWETPTSEATYYGF